MTELREIPTQYDQIQMRLDQADIGLNPLGLAKGVAPFDIDPTLVDQGQTHFEQIQERALKALDNAIRVWNEANSANNLIRQNQNSVEEFTNNVEDQESDYKNRLIEIFGYPYAGDIGPGQTYPSGYDGPDLVHYMYVATKELNGETAPPNSSFSAFYTPLKSTTDLNQGFTFPEDTPLGPGSVKLINGTNVVVNYPLSTAEYGFVAPTSWGQRRAPGELQQALSDMVQADARMKQAVAAYDKLVKDIGDMTAALQAQTGLSLAKITVIDKRNQRVRSLAEDIAAKQGHIIRLRSAGNLMTATAEAVAEAFPKEIGLSNDAFFAGRGTVLALGKVIGPIATTAAADALEAENAFSEKDKEVAANDAELELESIDAKGQQINQLKEIRAQLREELSLRLEIYNQREVVLQAIGRYQSILAQGQRVLDDRVAFRQRTSARTTENRYQDMTFRIFRNDALQKYRAKFDQASRYVFLAATAYDYESSLLGSDGRSGRNFLTDIIRHRSLGQFADGKPVPGRPGLADALGRMSQNFDVLKTQLGFNNPQVETGRFGLRSELFRIKPASDAAWREELTKHRVANLWDIPEFRRYCRPFTPEESGPQPGIMIRFPTTVTFGQNFFGWPLSGGDSAYDPSRFATKVRSVGVWFSDYNGNGLSLTPRVYLVPVGLDILRSPTSGDFTTREWRVVDQLLPVPFPIGPTALKNPKWMPSDALGGSFADIRKFASFRAFHDSGAFDTSEAISDSRLIGRSVWNTDWMLIIPGGTFLADQNAGLDAFISSVSDIKVFFQTYSYAGN